MWELLGQTGISEAILLFILIFIIPLLGYLLLKLRRYENQYGVIYLRGKKKKKKKKPEPPPKEMKPEKPSVPPDVFPYETKPFINPSEQMLLDALYEAIGGDIMIYTKVALSGLVQSTDSNPGFHDRLADKYVDFLICDKQTGNPFTAVCLEPGKKAPKGPTEELAKICQAANLHLVFLPQADSYDTAKVKKLLDIPDLGL